METVLLVIHLLIAIALVGVILLQKSEGGALGIGGGGGMMTARGTANLLTRTTAILAGSFMVTSILLAILSGNSGPSTSIIDTMPLQGAPLQEGVPLDGGALVPDAEAPVGGEVEAPAEPSGPTVPLAD